MTTTPCPWCGTPFEATRRGDQTKRFCRPACKNEYHSAARRFTEDMVEKGRISYSLLRELYSPAVHGTKTPES